VPETKIKTIYNGQSVDALDVPIIQSNELWNEYKLEDGNTLRIKFAVGSIVRVPGEKDPEGNPVYMVKGTIVTIPLVSDGQGK
jgi:hypothetical protein